MNTESKKAKIPSWEDISKAFADAIVYNDREVIALFLHERGEFNFYDKGKSIDGNKQQFLSWFFKKLDEYYNGSSQSKPLEYEIDQCLYCAIGNPVILFNKGRFPVYGKKLWEMEKNGLMLEFKEGKISGITFCGTFLRNENQLICELKYGRGNKNE